jgi:hypothetical protein
MTTTMTRPHLLTLPREIRNEIYSYLTKEVQFRWVWQQATGWDGGCIATVLVENMPFCAVLLTHSRLCEEYLEARCFKKLHATIDANFSISHHPECTEETLAKQQDQTAVFARIKHARVFINAFESRDVDTLSGLGCALADLVPDLTSLKLAVAGLVFPNDGDHNHKLWQNIEPLPVSSRPELFPNWSNKVTFANLPLVQRGEGYRLFPWCEVKYGDELPPPLRSSFGDKVYVSHGFYDVGVYTYTKDPAFKALCQPAEIAKHWPLRQYLEESTLAKMSDEDAEKARRVPFEIREWKEKRGEELKDW